MKQGNGSNAKEILRNLPNSRRDYTEQDIDMMISQELDKGEDMDVGAVSEAAQTNDKSTDDIALQKNWEGIRSRVDRRSANRKILYRLPRSAAVVILVILLISAGSVASYAFRWEFLTRIFAPVLGTIGIHMNVSDLGEAGGLTKALESDAGEILESESVIVRDISQVPVSISGYSVLPKWIPTGYGFNYAEVYSDANESSIFAAYKNVVDQKELFVQVVIYDQGARTAVNIIEKDETADMALGSIEVTEDFGTVNATFTDGVALYMAWGELSKDDILSVIQSIEGVQTNDENS